MGFSNDYHSLEANELSRSVAEDPARFLGYLGTLEVEHQRLTQATETLTARNLELNGIIERANIDFVKGRGSNDKEFTDTLVKRIVQLNDENRELQNCQEVNKLLVIQNKLLQDERQYQVEAVMNQAANIDKEYTRLTGVLHEYGVNAARLRNERDILKHNLDVTRRSGEIENAILKKEFDTKIGALNMAYDQLRAEVKTEISILEKQEQVVTSDVKLFKGTWRDLPNAVVQVKSKRSESSCFSEEGSDDTLNERFFQLQLNILALKSENKRLKGELDATQHIFTELAYSETRNRQLQFEVSTLASKFKEVSSEALTTFNSHFEKAMSTAWNNFGKLQLTMEDQLQGDVDVETAARIVRFSERIWEFGQLPLSNMEQDVRGLVESTCGHFQNLQERLNGFGSADDGSKNLKSCPPHPEEACKKFEGQAESEDPHNPTNLECLHLADQDNILDDSTNCDSSMIGPLLASNMDTSSERCKSESEETDEHSRDAKRDGIAESVYKEAAWAELSRLEREASELELSWLDPAFPESFSPLAKAPLCPPKRQLQPRLFKQ
ncbi:hypothetical protein IFR05_004229 [Cadophora sp. M221]|nr:hypothetical protein IFR05_004229 [Cadophora sp. M221]